ncbi:MAG TPA: acyl-CoA desaturase, partial [Actinopolymorphaceae bacterium]
AKIIRESGLLDRRRVYYIIRFAIVLGLFAAGWVAFFAIGESWWQLFVAAFMGVMFTQIAFLGHDVGHRQVFASKRTTQIAGLLLGNLGICLGYGWWIGKHTRHHSNPNHVDDDPDVGVGVIIWSEEQANERRGALSRWLGGRQAFWFFPILLLEGLNLHVASFRSLWDPEVKRKPIEATLLVLHVVLYLAALFAVLPVGMAAAFLLVHLGVFGVYMGCSFAPNHKGMPLLDEKMDFLRKQVLTSRNVRGNVLVDYALGGLNYQVEHHLFPSMPMPNLRKAQPIIRDYCEKLGVPYTETGLLQSYKEILGYLHEVGAPLRARS